MTSISSSYPNSFFPQMNNNSSDMLGSNSRLSGGMEDILQQSQADQLQTAEQNRQARKATMLKAVAENYR
ncbi:hypothetical protein RGV33_04435 [Pseudomonas sp. Bout1]|uniref:hypothetical protein n=1 Tax=Pseudomonas sp. Bout1 TaxID=3048600 RepID=UPI002AB43B32|nr:hypothetical protein [Pseudomonas sp. Bout1]MDY7530925.1 hypothetical protein [Pseudomonas sp. Bout1]MEB0189000.1 hypothetical protein [Pseudomonas sp. Bout1]